MTGPTLGQVIPYRYVWSHERAAGATEGRKDRPCVIAIVRPHPSGVVLVWVSPITHRTPDTPEGAIELPRRTRRRLGLDEGRSWIIATELNRFAWPGFDLGRTPDGRDAFGELPRPLFEALLQRIDERRRQGRLAQIGRDG